MNILFLEKRGSHDHRLRDAFSKIKDEFLEHLQAINENTNEIQANYEKLLELEAKFDKVVERIDEIAMFVKHPSSAERKAFEITPLTKNEQEVFQALYSLVHEKGQAKYAEVGRRSGFTEELVQSYITNLVEKGIPIGKRYLGKDVLLSIDSAFCELQAKENILQINEMISEKVISQ